MWSITLQIDGMSCGHCLKAVSTALRASPGVEQVRSVEMGRAEVTINETATSADKVANAVTEAGYPAKAVALS